jgi:indolepyruvate ferredoxin oxidoreductase
VRGLDQTGLAQKGGPVVSDVRILTGPPRHANRAGSGDVDAYLGMDLLGAVDPQNLATARPGHTVAAVSTSQIPTVAMVLDQRQGYGDASAYVAAVAARTRPEHNVYLDAQALAERLCGDAIAANTIVFGAAWQRGAIPVTLESVQTAIRLNGTEVERTLAAFHWGRCVVAAPHLLDPPGAPPPGAGGPGDELDRLLRVRVADLTAYQNAAYAQAYRSFVTRVHERERAVAPGSSELAEAVARNLYKLMAYKDEYEVARLSVDPAFIDGLRAEFGADARWAYHLQPPLLRALGLRRKLSLGSWIRPVLRALAALRRLRGTPLDVFGYSAVRRLERRLPAEYRQSLEHALARLGPTNLPLILDLAEAPDLIRGYERIKLDGVAAYRDRVAQVWAQLDVPAVQPSAASESRLDVVEA